MEENEIQKLWRRDIRALNRRNAEKAQVEQDRIKREKQNARNNRWMLVAAIISIVVTITLAFI